MLTKMLLLSPALPWLAIHLIADVFSGFIEELLKNLFENTVESTLALFGVSFRIFPHTIVRAMSVVFWCIEFFWIFILFMFQFVGPRILVKTAKWLDNLVPDAVTADTSHSMAPPEPFTLLTASHEEDRPRKRLSENILDELRRNDLRTNG